MTAGASTPEFSWPVTLSRMGRQGVFPIEAKPEERQALARRFGLLALDRLTAEVRLTRRAGGLIELTAELSADVVQACVVSLEPVPATLTESFSLFYAETAQDDPANMLPEDEIIEIYENDTIDIGEAVAQQLALALDPYPRAPGVAAGQAGTG